MNSQFLEHLAILTAVGARRGYVLYDEIDRLLRDEYSGGPEINEIFARLATADIDVRELSDRQSDAEPLEHGGDMEDPVNIYVRSVYDPSAHARETD